MTDRARRLQRLEKQIGTNHRGCNVPVLSNVTFHLPDNGRDDKQPPDSGLAVPGQARVIIYDPDIGIGPAV
jgi:hypothetical protein